MYLLFMCMGYTWIPFCNEQINHCFNIFFVYNLLFYFLQLTVQNSILQIIHWAAWKIRGQNFPWDRLAVIIWMLMGSDMLSAKVQR